jgi:hypothetical protein
MINLPFNYKLGGVFIMTRGSGAVNAGSIRRESSEKVEMINISFHSISENDFEMI